jgi:hypothetical protein
MQLLCSRHLPACQREPKEVRAERKYFWPTPPPRSQQVPEIPIFLVRHVEEFVIRRELLRRLLVSFPIVHGVQ